jgi:hypothetical protein
MNRGGGVAGYAGNPYVVNIQELQNTITSAGNVNALQPLSNAVANLQSMVNFDQKRIYTNVISQYNTSPIQILNDINLSNASLYVNNAQATASGTGVTTGSGLYLSSLGVGCNAPRFAVDISGALNASVGYFLNGTSFTSDRRIKTDISGADLSLCYSTVRELPLRRFEFIRSFQELKKDTRQLGFIADEVEEVFPKSVHLADAPVKGLGTIRFVNFEQIHMAHYGATQQLMKIVEAQGSTICGMQATLAALTSQMK